MRNRICQAAIVWCLSLAPVALAEACTGNPCLRAVKSTAPQRNATADCISFFEAAKPVTRTVTTTLAVNSTAPRLSKPTEKGKTTLKDEATGTAALRPPETEDLKYEAFDGLRLDYGQALEEPRPIPEYATPCSSIGDYSSACSCLGVTLPSTAAARATTTVTSTVTAFNATGIPFFRNGTSIGNSTARFQSTTSSLSKPKSSISSSSVLTNTPRRKSSSSTSAASVTQKPAAAFIATTSLKKAATNLPPSPPAATPAKGEGKGKQTETGKGKGKENGKENGKGKGKGKESSTTVQVVKTTTVISSGHLWANTSLASSFQINSTSRYWNATGFTSANTTSTTALLTTSNTTRWHNVSSTSFSFLSNTTRPIWLNTSLPTLSMTNSTVRWPNTTSLPTLNSTSVRWPNSTATPRYQNTSSSLPPTSTSTSLPYPTTCGKTNPPFHMQISSPSSPFNSWFVSLTGNTLFFVSNATSASSFSVEPSGHMCVVGYVDADGIPAVAAVERREGVGGVWMLRRKTVEGLEGDYAVLKCERGGEGVECAVEGGEGAGGREWVGCGIQLGARREDGGGEVGDGVRCEGVGVRIV